MSEHQDGLVAALGTAAGAAFLWIVRRLMRTPGEKREDTARRDIIGTLERERDEARKEATRERESRTQDARRIARLEAVNEFLERELRMAMRGMSDEARRIIDTNFAALGDPE